MRIFNVLPYASYQNEQTQYARALNEMFVFMGYRSRIYALHSQNEIQKDALVKPMSEFPDVNTDDILIYHYNGISELDKQMPHFLCKKGLVYYTNNEQDEKQLSFFSDVFDFAFVDCTYNQDYLLDELHFNCSVEVIPPSIPLHCYNQGEDNILFSKYADASTNVLCVADIAPCQNQQTIVQTFYEYATRCDKTARLFLIGNVLNKEYEQQLTTQIQMLGLTQQIFILTAVNEEDLLTYYHLADMFIYAGTQSHFYSPFVQAMFFDVPIITSFIKAVPSLLKDSGVLLHTDSIFAMVAAMQRVQNDVFFRTSILQRQQKRLKDFEYKAIQKKLLNVFTPLIEGSYER